MRHIVTVVGLTSCSAYARLRSTIDQVQNIILFFEATAFDPVHERVEYMYDPYTLTLYAMAAGNGSIRNLIRPIAVHTR